jgi:phospholipid/cholesterol/gamma-HCH transport system substrate-binding protein
METRANYVLLGGAAIIGAALMMLFAMWLARAQWGSEYAIYDVVFEGPVRGLANGGEVRFNGIKVGEVEQLSIDPTDANRVFARIRVNATTPVKADSEGQLEQIGLTGVTLIQISAGTESLPILRQGLGQPVPQIAGRPDPFNEILAAGGDIATRASETLAAARDLLTEENIASFSRTLHNLEDITAELAAQRAAFRAAGQAAANFAVAGQQVALLAQDARTRLSGLDANATATLQQTTQTLEDLSVAVEEARSAMAEVEAATANANDQLIPEVAAAARDLRRLSVAVEGLAVEVEEDPYNFVFNQSRPTVEVRP